VLADLFNLSHLVFPIVCLILSFSGTLPPNLLLCASEKSFDRSQDAISALEHCLMSYLGFPERGSGILSNRRRVVCPLDLSLEINVGVALLYQRQVCLGILSAQSVQHSIATPTKARSPVSK
jgi:hypothetical protein